MLPQIRPNPVVSPKGTCLPAFCPRYSPMHAKVASACIQTPLIYCISLSMPLIRIVQSSRTAASCIAQNIPESTLLLIVSTALMYSFAADEPAQSPARHIMRLTHRIQLNRHFFGSFNGQQADRLFLLRIRL
jgi:hypothetical protein